MDKFVIRKPRRPQDSSSTQDADLTQDSSSTQDLSSKHDRVDVTNLPSDPGLRKKISFFILMIEMKLENIVYKKNHVNLMDMIFLKQKLVDLCVDLILNDLKSMKVGWNMVLKRMLHIVYIVTYLDKMLVCNLEVTVL